MSNLPYDAEIEYLESTGTQYINTNYTPIIGDSIHIEFMLDTALSSTNRALYSAGTGTYQVIHLLSSSPNGAYYKHFAQGNAKTFAYYPTTDIWYTLDVTGNGVATIGDYTSTSTPEAQLDGNATTLWLCMRRNGTSPFVGKIKRFWIENSGVKKLDYIPVRVGSTGYMYDKVGGQLFGNSGTDDFILGKDKALPNPFGFRRRLLIDGGDIEFCDYIYTTNDNKAYIDTGILPSESLRVEGNMAFVVWSAYYIIFGTRTGTDRNEFTLQAYNNNRIRAIYGNSYTTSQLPNVGANMFSVDWNGNIVNINGTTYTFGSKTFSTPYTLYLFGLNNVGEPSLFPSKIWSCKMWENDVIVRDYRPAKRISTGKYGLYDMVSRQFFLSPNGVDFFGGND